MTCGQQLSGIPVVEIEPELVNPQGCTIRRCSANITADTLMGPQPEVSVRIVDCSAVWFSQLYSQPATIRNRIVIGDCEGEVDLPTWWNVNGIWVNHHLHVGLDHWTQAQ